MVINRKVLPWLIAGVALAAILLIVLVMVTQASPNSAPHRQGTSGENLLINPSFESGMSNWTTSSASATENDVALCGSGGVTVTSDVGGSIYQTIVSIPTSTIYVNAFFRTDSTATAVLRYDSVNVNGQSANAVVSQGIDSGDGWTQLSLLVQGVGQYPITLTVSVGTNAAESVMVDSIWVGDYNNDDICAGWQPDPIPQIVSYQGQVSIGGIPYSGTGYFQFAIVDSVDTLYWSNDGSTITPTEAVTLTVINGLFNALLGETNPITYGIFSDSDRWLRVWFDDGTHGVQLLEPDTRFTTAPFAFQADNATTALTATNATTATYATTALTATNATTATYATTADSATTALTATNATTATYATTALTATNLTQSPYARIYNDANISIPAYTWITITFNSELWDTTNFHSTESNTSRMIAPVTGTYLITFNGRFASSSSGERFVYLRMNANGAIAGGTGIAYTSTATRVGGYQTGVSATALYFLTAEDYVEAFVMQSSDVTLACTYSANDSPQLTMVLLP